MAKSTRVTLSDRHVNALGVSKDTIFWDRRLQGFGVRVYPTGGKVYIAQARGPQGRKRKRVGPHGVLTAGQARKRAAQIIARIQAGEPCEALGMVTRRDSADGPTVAELAKRYLDDYVGLRLKSRTAKRIRGVLNRHILPEIGTVPIKCVKRSQVMALHQRLCSKPATANQVLGTLSFMYRLAETWGYVSEGYNPCRGVKRYPARHRERFLTDRELDRLGKALSDMECQSTVSWSTIAALRLLVLTGCRKNEILRLRWEHVVLDAAELRLPDAKTGARTIALPAAAVSLLEHLPRIPGNPWVLPGRVPGAHIRTIYSTWYKIRKKAGLKDVRIHDLRHSYASRALALGETLPVIAKLLGHRRIETTARYAHLAQDSVLESAERVALSLAEDLCISMPRSVP